MKFLITNLFINSFTGSEINALSLSEALVKLGHEVVVGTFEIKNPMAGVFDNKHIPVINLLSEDVDNFNYDVIWGHHFPTMDHVVLKKNWESCRLLFSSLSYIMPVEAPPAFHEDIPLILSYSPVNTEVMISNGISPTKIHYFPNYADESFFCSAPSNSEKLKKVLIVSNHPPLELMEFMEHARDKGLTVDLVGWTGEPKLVDVNLLAEYDLVITIGKTVIYCFAAQVPVYCYDHFGGQGYITEDNFEYSLRNNFSGKGFDRHLTSQEILDDVLAGYHSAVSRLEYLHEICKDRLNLGKNLAIVLEKIKALPLANPIQLKKKYSLVERHHDAQPFWASYFTDNDLIAKKLLKFLREDKENPLSTYRLMILDQLNSQVLELTKEKTDLQNELRESQNNITKLKNSTSWRITKPVRLVKDVMNKLDSRAAESGESLDKKL